MSLKVSSEFEKGNQLIWFEIKHAAPNNFSVCKFYRSFSLNGASNPSRVYLAYHFESMSDESMDEMEMDPDM